MSQESLQTMIMQKFWGVKEVYYGMVQVVNSPNPTRTPRVKVRGSKAGEVKTLYVVFHKVRSYHNARLF